MVEQNKVQKRVYQDSNILSKKIRQTILEMSKYSQFTMHFGGSLSCVEILAVLFGNVLKKYDGTPDKEQDKFLLSKGHAALGLYATLYNINVLSLEELKTYQANGSELTELVEFNQRMGFDCSGGSLGLNLSYGLGMALLAKKERYVYKVYALLGDGELDEGSVWEAIMLAGQLQLDNLVMIIDENKMQSDGLTQNILAWDRLPESLSNFGWHVVETDGHNCEQLQKAFDEETLGKPKAIIAHTIKGKGISFMENDNSWHDRRINKTELENALEEVGEFCLN